MNMILRLVLISFLWTVSAYSQLTITNDNQQTKSPLPETNTESSAEDNSTAHDQTETEDNLTEEKYIPADFSVSAKTWGVGAGLSLNTALSPSRLDGETNAGAGFQLWGRYQFNEHVGSQLGLYQHDYSDSSFGITALKYSVLFQTGWPEGFYPFFGIGMSINNVNKSEIYGRDYTELGWQMSLGAHLASEKLGNRAFFIPQVEFFQVFEKNNDAKAITGLAFLISLGYFFDAEDFTKNVSLINGK